MKAGVQAERETLNYRVKREATRYLQEVVIHSLIHSFNTYLLSAYLCHTLIHAAFILVRDIDNE